MGRKRVQKRKNSQFQSLNNSTDKFFIIEKMLADKLCVICKLKQTTVENQMFLCDSCDDGYHQKCLKRQDLHTLDHFLCSYCQREQQKFLAEKNKNEKSEQMKKQVCKSCQKKILDIDLNQYLPAKYIRKNQQKKILIAKTDYNQVRKCRYCHDYFHKSCFSRRQNSVCCSECEKKIRFKCPKNHEQYIKWIEEDLQAIERSQLFMLEPLKSSPQINFKKPTYLRLKCFEVATEWQQIVRYQASLYYALHACKMRYCQVQLYPDQKTMNLNQKQYLSKQYPVELCQEDEKQFEKFLNNVKAHRVGSFQIKQDPIKGFYVVATDFIPAGTIICEYVGEVCTKRDLYKHANNDSVMSLTYNDFSFQGLDIAPIKYANMSRYVSGINNNDRNQQKLQNVDLLNILYQGRSRIIYYAMKNIEKDSTLYLNYNKGIYQEYPTQNFVQ